MVSDEIVKKWLEENYPDYANNLEFGKKLYERLVLGKRANKITNIEDLSPDEWATIKGVVVAVYDPNHYEGCPICFKKQCEHLATGEAQPTTIYIPKFRVMDETGDIVVSGKFTTDFDQAMEPYEIGTVLKIRGKVQEYNDKFSMSGYDIEILKEAPEIKSVSPNAVKVLSDLKKIGAIQKSFFENKMLKSAGVEWSEIEPYVIVKEIDGKEMVFPNASSIDEILGE